LAQKSERSWYMSSPSRHFKINTRFVIRPSSAGATKVKSSKPVVRNLNFDENQTKRPIDQHVKNVQNSNNVFEMPVMAKIEDRQSINNTRITVAVRMRPSVDNQQQPSDLIKCQPKKNIVTVIDKNNIEVDKRHRFDFVFGPDSTQSEVYHTVAAPLIEEIPFGINACIIAYGQTGAGKTFTLTGQSGERAGILPRAIQNLFTIIESDFESYDYTIKLSYLQIYMENVS
jgi:hypothetical protein